MPQQNIVLVGRLVGVGIIFAGIGLAAWDEIESYRLVGDDGFLTFGLSKSSAVRDFLDASLNWVYRGLIVVAGAEIVHQLRRGRGRAAATLDVIALCRVAGTVMIFAGPALSIWDIIEENRRGYWENAVTFVQARAFLRDVLHWLFAGLLIVVAAGIADRLRQRGGWRPRTKGVAP